ncbi:MAG: hypothetical protein E6Q97_12930 [Desulfurellales bacterium]|nr:MAG: hypothetical protein E6Q97_12930 [Desulfurellales bacterium]
MSDLGTMKTRIASEILRADWADSYVASAITDAIDDYSATRFRFNAARFRLNTVSGQEFYTLPDALLSDTGSALSSGEDVIEIDAVNVRFNGAAFVLTPVTDGWSESFTTTTTTGQPQYYSWTGQKIRFTPIPDQVYEVRIVGLKKLLTLATNAASNGWTTDGAALIRARAKVRLYRDILRNADMAAAAQAEELSALTALTRAANAQQSGRLQAWGY